MKIQTKHPNPEKQGVNIDKEKYDIIKNSITSLLSDKQPQTFKELNQNVSNCVTDFDGSVGWYFTTIKLDLEARKVIKVDRSSSPQLISLVE